MEKVNEDHYPSTRPSGKYRGIVHVRYRLHTRLHVDRIVDKMDNITKKKMTIKINRNKPIPIPPKPKPKRERVYQTYPWDDMEVGDSFLFPEGTANPYSYLKYHPNFLIKSTPEGYRCWRIK